MAIEKQPFRQYNLDGNKQDIIPLRINPEERDNLEKIKRILKQPKDSTAIKQMLSFAMLYVIHDPSIGYLLRLQFKNEANSRESGNFAETLKTGDL